MRNPELSKYFKRHGFKVEDKNLKNNLLDTLITVNQQGPATALLSLLGNHNIEKQSLLFKDLLEHIPEISDIYFKSTQKASSVAFLTNYGNYNLKSENWEEDLNEKKDLLEYFHLCGSYIGRTREFSFFITMAGSGILNETNSRKNFFYKDSVILPIKLEEGTYSINVMYYAYLIIMAYGMIVRYNASKWEKYIDPKLSNESTLISESLTECVKIFIQHVHIILFGYTYDYPKYDDENVKEVIKDSTKDIMKNIREEIISENRRSGKKIYLPW